MQADACFFSALENLSLNSTKNGSLSNGGSKKCLIIGVSGGSGSGKTTFAKNIIKLLNIDSVAVMTMDSYYRELTEEEKALAYEGRFDFDHPSSIDSELLFKHFSELKEGKIIDVPVYDFTTHSRTSATNKVGGVKLIIFEGIMTFCYKDLLKLLDLKIFIDTDAELRLSRRIKRDIVERGRHIHDIITQYFGFVKPAYDSFIEPTKALADIIVPCGKQNPVAINFIVGGIRELLEAFDKQLKATEEPLKTDSNEQKST